MPVIHACLVKPLEEVGTVGVCADLSPEFFREQAPHESFNPEPNRYGSRNVTNGLKQITAFRRSLPSTLGQHTCTLVRMHS